MIEEIKHTAEYLTRFIKPPNYTPEQIKTFQTHIITKLTNNKAFQQTWNERKPWIGNAARCITVATDKMFTQSPLGDVSDIFPTGLVIWVDPFCVAYRVGDYGKCVSIWENKEAMEELMAASSNRNRSNSSSANENASDSGISIAEDEDKDIKEKEQDTTPAIVPSWWIGTNKGATKGHNSPPLRGGNHGHHQSHNHHHKYASGASSPPTMLLSAAHTSPLLGSTKSAAIKITRPHSNSQVGSTSPPMLSKQPFHHHIHNHHHNQYHSQQQGTPIMAVYQPQQGHQHQYGRS